MYNINGIKQISIYVSFFQLRLEKYYIIFIKMHGLVMTYIGYHINDKTTMTMI